LAGTRGCETFSLGFLELAEDCVCEAVRWELFGLAEDCVCEAVRWELFELAEDCVCKTFRWELFGLASCAFAKRFELSNKGRCNSDNLFLFFHLFLFGGFFVRLDEPVEETGFVRG